MQLIGSPHCPPMVDHWHSVKASQEWVWLKIHTVSSFSITLYTMNNGTMTHTVTWTVRTCKVEGQFCSTKVYVPLAEDDNCEPWTKFDLIHRQYLHYYTRLRCMLHGMSDGGLDILGCKVTSVCVGVSIEKIPTIRPGLLLETQEEFHCHNFSNCDQVHDVWAPRIRLS